MCQCDYQVVAALSPEFGLIEVRAGEDRVQVVFHLEDVWDTAGQPALLSPGLSMQALQGRPPSPHSGKSH